MLFPVLPVQLAALEFPPKKLFGNRDERMLAERRIHLEVSGIDSVNRLSDSNHNVHKK